MVTRLSGAMATRRAYDLRACAWTATQWCGGAHARPSRHDGWRATPRLRGGVDPASGARPLRPYPCMRLHRERLRPLKARAAPASGPVSGASRCTFHLTLTRPG